MKTNELFRLFFLFSIHFFISTLFAANISDLVFSLWPETNENSIARDCLRDTEIVETWTSFGETMDEKF